MRVKHEKLNSFVPEEYFKYYDYWSATTSDSITLDEELLSKQLDTTNAEGKKYEINLIEINDIDDKMQPIYFFVAEEIYTKDELEKLKLYCRCRACKASYFNLEKYLTCRCCVGCLHSDRISHYVVKETRKYYKYKQLPFLTRFSFSVDDF